ncbi:MAG: hypothetical protein E7319_05500 [Clostridiales bacterium]|nr:hypothetical protein [Clostridiales bacterium]
MGCYVLAIGGTGNKILESIVYAAAADAFYTISPNGKRTPVRELHLLSVDVDAACGNTTRASRAAEYYEQVRAAFDETRQTRRGFRTRLDLRRWNMNLSRRATSVSRMTENHARDQLLSRTLFSKTEASLEYSEGFRGHPDLGVLFFSDLLSSLDQLRAMGQPDEMNALLDQMDADISRGETVKVMLCGSIFGGTGASGIPALARYLHERFRDRLSLFEMGSMLMLPYYKVPPSSHNEELEIVVKSADFPDKARTALQYYGMSGMIRSSEEDTDGVFDAIYMLGLPPEAFVQTRIYSTGSQSQENDAHMLEWLATRCIAAFLRTGMRGANAHNMDCYYYQWHTPSFCWQSFDSEGELYRVGYGGLLKASALFFAECYPSLRKLVTGSGRGGSAIGYCAPYFSDIHHMNALQRDQLEKLLDALYHFFAFYANWMVQLTRTIPPTMRPKQQQELRLDEASHVYQLLIQRRAQLKMNGEGTPGYDTLVNDRMDAQSQCDILLPQIGGEAWLEMLFSARHSAQEQLRHQETLVADQEELLHRITHQERQMTSPEEVRRQQEKLASLRLIRDEYALRLHLMEEDIRSAVRADLPGHYPAPAAVRHGDVPENDLLSASVLSALYTLLRQYGTGAEERDPDAMSRSSLNIQRSLHKLILSAVPDRRTTAYAIAALGGGRCAHQTPGGVIASFTATLLAAVMEDSAL